MAVAPNPQLEILDLRHFSAAQLRPLLQDEAARWQHRLHWDYARASATLLEYLDGRILPGYVALRAGKVVGYAFCVFESAKAVIGDIYAFGETESLLNPICETLLHHLIELLQATPGVDRIESQLLMFPAGALAAPYRAADFRSAPRLFMFCNLSEHPSPNHKDLSSRPEARSAPNLSSRPEARFAPNLSSRPEARSAHNLSSRPEARSAPNLSSRPEARFAPNLSSRPEARSAPNLSSRPEARSAPNLSSRPEARFAPNLSSRPEARSAHNLSSRPEARFAPNLSSRPEARFAPNLSSRPEARFLRRSGETSVFSTAHSATTAPQNPDIQTWQPEFYDAAADLIRRCYEAHMDADINDQYRTMHGAQRFLHNIIRFPGCGLFDPANSWVIRNPTTSALEALLLCSRVRGDVAHITQLCVSPTQRGHGVGELLLQHGMTHLARQGIRHVSLTVTEANTPALKLYEANGFTTLHRFEAMVWDKHSPNTLSS